MRGKRVWGLAGLAALLLTAGCHRWCERWCGCDNRCGGYPAYAAPVAPACVPCVPCCPAPSGYTPPPAAPSGSWTRPSGVVTPCVCPE